MSALLEIRDLTVRRDKRQVLTIQALTVETGEVLAIVGPNGTGKSSLLLTLAHLLQPERGELFWQGRSYKECNALTYRRRIALGLPSAEIKDRVNRWLVRVGIEALRDRCGARLSGGEAQRVSLARAFVLNPELLLLDEPFSALDAPTRLRLLDDLKSILTETGTTAVIVTHDLKEAAKLASRVAIMLGGQIVQIGAPLDVFANPANPAVAAFLGL